MNFSSKPMDLTLILCPTKSSQIKNQKKKESHPLQRGRYSHARKNRGEQEGIVKLRVEIDGVRQQFSLKEKSKFKDWLGTVSMHKRDAELNGRISRVLQEFKTLNLLMSSMGVKVSSENIIKTYCTLRDKDLVPNYENLKNIEIFRNSGFKGKARPTVIELIKEYQDYSLTILSKDTVKSHDIVTEHLTEFLGKDKNIYAEDFQKSHLLKYIDFLTKEKCLKGTTIKNTHFSFIKRVYKHFIARDIIPPNNLTTVLYSARSEPDLRNISIEQLKYLSTYYIQDELPKRQRSLRIAKDLFVFSCFTGFHTVERVNINGSHLKIIDNSFFLVNNRSKTQKTFHVKLHPVAIAIIYKYSLKPISYLNQQTVESMSMFDVLKIGLNHIPRLGSSNLNYYLELLEKRVGFKLYSTKIGRKTFANTSINHWDIPVHLVAEAMGITIDMVGKYGKANIKSVSKAYNFDDAA